VDGADLRFCVDEAATFTFQLPTAYEEIISLLADNTKETSSSLRPLIDNKFLFAV
jgi:hypothetical protein